MCAFFVFVVQLIVSDDLCFFLRLLLLGRADFVLGFFQLSFRLFLIIFLIFFSSNGKF